MSRFKTSARTVDMLGRQQIAGIPTAISELYKNAHDAYAQEAVADFLRQARVFVLRDDGHGMTREEFENRWLMLGTSSKAVPRRGPSKSAQRAILGEKGIGRLAIAAIGSQVLVFTRTAGAPTMTVALINWGVFELAHAELSQIVIPVVDVVVGKSPDLTLMADEIADNLRRLSTEDDRELVQRVLAEVALWRNLDLESISEAVRQDLTSFDHGTCFVITPTSSDLEADLEPPAPKEAPPLLRTLIGFANTMTPGHLSPKLHTAFRDHRAIDDIEDLIAEGEFFTEKDFTSADHLFQGRFDDYGRFRGDVTIFGQEPIEYPLTWTPGHGLKTKCGPFDLALAYIQGQAKQSRLDSNAYALILDKLDRYGGLYIYRDNIRVLPYGDNRFDWLDVELRRTKSASDNFFSYRRMFGTVAITRDANHALREKAGREGFATNEAYRQFRAILENFLTQVAAEFFRESAPQAALFEEGRRANERMHKAMVNRNRQVRVKRAALAKEIENHFDSVSTGAAEARARGIVRRLRAETELASAEPTAEAAARHLVDAEDRARTDLTSLTESLRIKRPRGVSLSVDLARRAAAYDEARHEFVQTVIAPVESEIDDIAVAANNAIGLAAARQLRLDQAVETAITFARKRFADSRSGLRRVANEVPPQARQVFTQAHREIELVIDAVLRQSNSTDLSTLHQGDYVTFRDSLERQLTDVTNDQTETIDALIDQISALGWDARQVGNSPLDQMQSLEERVEELTNQADQDFELVQLGLAVNIVTHEFENSVKAVRNNLRRLRGWAQQNPDLRPLYSDLRASFDHLDGYLKLFTPLHRRLYRNPVRITGRDVRRYLEDVFRQRLDSTNVSLQALTSFETMSVNMYPSTLYSALVGLVDNAIYWLSGYRGDRRIELSFENDVIAVTDSGAGVKLEDRDNIFKRGYSRKPGGTGYGLFIAAQVLERDGARIELAPSDPDRGARFEITPPPDLGESK